jgi:hypothetical protein
MALFSVATGVRFPSCLSRDHSVFLRMDRIADNSEETDAIFFFRRWMEETIEYKTTRINMAKIGPRYFGSNRDAGRLVIDSTIQEIIMPGLSIVFPHFPMMALSLFSPLQDTVDTGAIQNIAFSAPHPPREAGAGGTREYVVSLPRDVACL